MNGPRTGRRDAPKDADAASGAVGDAPAPAPAEPDARHQLDRHRAETERLRVLVDFLARPIHAAGGGEPDPDIVSAYNLAVEAALRCVRRAAAERPD